MREWNFSLIIDGDLSDEILVEKLAGEGVDDATFGVADGVSYADFHREAASFTAALFSAISDLERIPGIRVFRVEPDDLVTLSEAAKRLNRTRESVRLLAAGRRGKGTFPPPISHLWARSKLWRWSDIAEWAGELDEEEERRAHFVALCNAVLEGRRLVQRASPDEKKDVLAAADLFESALAHAR